MPDGWTLSDKNNPFSLIDKGYHGAQKRELCHNDSSRVFGDFWKSLTSRPGWVGGTTLLLANRREPLTVRVAGTGP